MPITKEDKEKIINEQGYEVISKNFEKNFPKQPTK